MDNLFSHLDDIYFRHLDNICLSHLNNICFRHLEKNMFYTFGGNDGGAHLVAVDVEMATVVGEPLVGNLVFVPKHICPNCRI